MSEDMDKPFTEEQATALAAAQGKIEDGLREFSQILRDADIEAFPLTLGRGDPAADVLSPMVWSISLPGALRIAHHLGEDWFIMPVDDEDEARIRDVIAKRMTDDADDADAMMGLFAP